MTVTADDLGVLGNLATAVGLLDSDGEPNAGWFGDPAKSLSTILAEERQREALVAFVDEAMGGADREADASGATWLPVVSLDDPQLTVSVTVDDEPADRVIIGLGVSFATTNPGSRTSASVPLFQAAKANSTPPSTPIVLGEPGGRLTFATQITVDDAPPVPGEARLGAIGLEVEVPTDPADDPASFGLVLEGFQLPGATSPRDLRVAASSPDELDDAILDLVLSLLRAQAEAVGGDVLEAVVGLLGLGGDAVPPFPIEQLPAQGAQAIAAWIEGILGTTSVRQTWLGHIATLVGGSRDGDEVELSLGAIGATIRLGLRAEPGPTGRLRLTATLGADVGGPLGGPGSLEARAEARADVFRVDLGSGEALAVPAVGLWASVGRQNGTGPRVLDVDDPIDARADRLRLGFALDAERRLTFVLAADDVLIGDDSFPVLDLTSPDAVMDAAGAAVEDVAEELLGQLGGAVDAVKALLGLDPPPGHPAVPTISLADLLGNPVGAVSGYWQTLLTAHGAAVPAVLGVVRDAVADAASAALPIQGVGTAADPWRIPLVDPVRLEAHLDGDVLSVAVAAGTSVDTLGQRCTVLETRLAATVVTLDLGEQTAQLLPAVEGRLVARERGVSPPQVRLALDESVGLTAEHVGVALLWTAAGGLAAQLRAPELTLHVEEESVPIVLPTIGADGSVTFPPEGWDAVQTLIGHLAGLFDGVIGDAVRLLGWGGRRESEAPGLRLADLVHDPEAAFAAWLPQLLVSEVVPEALGTLAHLLTSAGPVSGTIVGSGHPDDPYRLAFAGPGVPELAVWFPPAGLEPRHVAAPEPLRRWRPGSPPLEPAALAEAIEAEAGVAADVRDLALGRDLAGGLSAFATRWSGGDGRIVPPATEPEGVTVVRYAVAAGQLLDRLDLEEVLGRAPTTVVYVAIGAGSWPDAPAGRLVDLTAPALAPEMFTPPAPVAGEWFVALGERAAARLAAGDDDGTVGQAARLRRVLDALAPLGNDLVVVGVGGAGHAARLAAQAQAAFSDVVTVGTPLGAIALTALDTQPTADALRFLGRLLPPEAAGEDEDLALGRHLVEAMLELADRAEPSIELRLPATALPAPRAGLATTAVFGVVDDEQVGRALTAAVAAGLATRARERAAAPLPEPTGIRTGIRLVLPESTTGTVAVEGSALLTLAGYDRAGGLATGRELRVRLLVRDRLGWLIAEPDHALRCVTADVTIPLGGTAGGAGRTEIVLHDARAFGVDRERLVLGTTADATALVPEARLLLSVAVQRLVADTVNPLAASLVSALQELGLVADGGAAPGAVEQLIHDPAGLVAARLAAVRPALSAALDALLGPIGAGVDLDTGTVTVVGGGGSAGLFGWDGELTAGPGSLTGHLTIGPDAPPGAAGSLQLRLALAPFSVSLLWTRPGDPPENVPLWPAPDGDALAALLARAAPSLGAHVALEVMRRADEDARPVIDAVLDALGMLGGAAGDDDRPLRPLAGLLADPAGWLRSGESIAGQPAKAQALVDALRPLTGLGGSPGEALPFADGVTLAVRGSGADLVVELALDTSDWTPIATPLGRLVGGLSAALVVPAGGAPSASFALHAGLGGADAGRRAAHVRLGAAGIEVFLRPAAGPDVVLVPFAGLGSLASAAAFALPFLLDQLAAEPAPIGPAVAGVGDALALRSGTPKQFDAAALSAWAADPVAALTTALPSIVETGLTTLAPVIDPLVPGPIAVTATPTALTVAAGSVSLSWEPSESRVAVSGSEIEVPGIETLAFTLALSDEGLDELSLDLGPAAIDAGVVTLRPYVTIAAGEAPSGGRRIAVGLATGGDSRFGARWLLGPGGGFALIGGDGPIDDPDPTVVALRAVEAVADLVAAVALETEAVQELLDTAVDSSSVRDLLAGVVLDDTNPNQLIDGFFDPATALDRAKTLATNLAGAGLSITFEGMTIRLLDQMGVIGVQLELTQRTEIVPGDVTLWLENDDAWIEDNPPGSGGVFVGLVPTAGGLRFEPSLSVLGLGLRIGKTSGPLLDVGVTLESIALHTFARIGVAVAPAGGVQLQFSNLAVSAAGASGGNSIASGILKDSGSQPPKPAFSPALAIQKHGSEDVHVTLRAGEGDGPWWLAIQKGFGPLYLEQVGLGVTMPQRRVDRISLLMDGSVSLFGLTCAVDDLQITYIVSRGDFFNSSSWDVDLAGLAVTADLAGLAISGGLLKSGTPPNVEYLGMLLARFGVYGITIYGGYGEGEDEGQRFVAFFAVGAVVGPIGGPPAFFITGIGGGFGINRALVIPTELGRFGDYPLIQALDIAAAPANPMEQLRSLGTYFPMERGTFWFAAGISFNSFALVDGIAVVAVEVGDGLDINLLGLARVALPRPQVALVSIELALLVRFSSSEGVLWVQGQLTDNSWLLYPDVRITGGFAFVTWFKGEHAGEFVVTMGGYHPDFHKPGYPQVPRLGVQWSIGDAIVIKAGGYFALTSEAVMAGGDFEASAEFGPAWAEVRFGAHGIVYFDPFRFKVNAYARIAAGVTIDTWLFGEITISISLGCSVMVEGPDFHGKATFEVGPIELTVEFGSTRQEPAPPLPAGTFIDKYLERGPAGGARSIAIVVSSGAQPSGGGAPTPDGGPDRPFVVVAEFSLVLTSTVPATDVRRLGGAALLPHQPPSRQLGVAPMRTGSISPAIELAWRRGGAVLTFPFAAGARPFGAFPVGVWGPPQDDDNRKTPTGDIISALNELDLVAAAVPSAGGPEIPYYQVRPGKRKPLPFSRATADATRIRNESKALAGLVPEPASVDAAFVTAERWLADRSSPTALAALRGERQAPPRFGTLGEGLDALAESEIPEAADPVAKEEADRTVHPPVAIGVLAAAGVPEAASPPRGTTVKDADRLWRTTPPTLASVELARSRSIASELVLVEADAPSGRKIRTVVAAGDVPPTAVARTSAAAVETHGGVGRERLLGLTASLAAGRRAPAAQGTPATTLAAGEVAVLRLPNADRDVGDGERPELRVQGGAARLVALANGGEVLVDRDVAEANGQAWTVEQGTERLAVIALGDDADREAGLVGWHAALQLPYVGWSTALGARCTVRSAMGEGIPQHRERVGAGWVAGAELARGVSTVTTRFAIPVTSVLVVLDDPEALGGEVDGRRLLLGLEGATRAIDGAGEDRPPALLVAENRAVLAYDVVPSREGDPVKVTIASEAGWSLAGVLGGVDLSGDAALAVVAAKGLDGALRPLVPGQGGGVRLGWAGGRPRRGRRGGGS